MNGSLLLLPATPVAVADADTAVVGFV